MSEGRGLFWYCLRDAVTDNKMIPQALSLHMMNLSLSCRKISFFSERMSYVIYNAHLAARMPRRSWIRMYDKYKSDFFTFLENDNPLYFYCLLKRVPNLLDDTSSEQVVDFWFLPLFLPKYYCIHSFWSKHTEKRNHTISQMRLRSVFKMRMSILNTATTEQMGYGMISFFVCSP